MKFLINGKKLRKMMKIIDIVDYDVANYKKASMFIRMAPFISAIQRVIVLFMPPPRESLSRL